MERGYYHPSRGYWQTMSEPSAEVLATFPEGTIEVPLKPGADYEWDEVEGEWVYVDPELLFPVEVEPVRIACALRIPIQDGEVQQIGGSFRVTGMILMDAGIFLAIFSQSLGPVQPFVIPNNGVSIEIAEWGEDYAVLEVRDHAGGSLITPAFFGFSLYQI